LIGGGPGAPASALRGDHPLTAPSSTA
jgi:hypothetical protein